MKSNCNLTPKHKFTHRKSKKMDIPYNNHSPGNKNKNMCRESYTSCHLFLTCNGSS